MCVYICKEPMADNVNGYLLAVLVKARFKCKVQTARAPMIFPSEARHIQRSAL